MLRQIAELLSVLICGLFAGAAIYISFVEHPAGMECAVEVAVWAEEKPVTKMSMSSNKAQTNSESICAPKLDRNFSRHVVFIIRSPQTKISR